MIHIGLISALILFLEMFLIRWIGTEIRIFAYLQNGVLVAVFLGLGIGCRNARRTIRLFPAILALLLIALIIRDPFEWHICKGLTSGLSSFKDTVIWSELWGQSILSKYPYLRFVLASFSLMGTVLLLLAIAYIFYPLGQWLGRWMDQYPHPITAYTLNICGSIVGIYLFNLATIIQTPPWMWMVISSLGLAILVIRAEDHWIARFITLLIALSLPFVTYSSTEHQTIWSPYQKLALKPLKSLGPMGNHDFKCGQLISVNDTGYQLLLNLDPSYLQKNGKFTPDEIRTSHYHLPYSLINKPQHALVVGSGAGNDIAAALLSGVKSVQAVEIDPSIVELGRQYHPNKPYNSNRVALEIDDARAYFRRSGSKYDLIWFGMLDSHTNPSVYTNIRLDHFVYTRESFADMKELLTPDGVVVMFFEAQRLWIADRLALLFMESFGHQPLLFHVRPKSVCLGWGGVMFIAGSKSALEQVRSKAQSDPILNQTLVKKALPLQAELTTDDWPYLYLEHRSIPKYHILVGLACLLVGFFLRRRLFQKGEDINLPMLLLGAGFMLLEVSGVSRAAMLYGTTWTVNAYIVGAILTMVLLANLVASRIFFEAKGWPFFGLIGCLLLLILIPPAWIASLTLPLRILVGGAFLSLPAFFSGLIFVKLWAENSRKDHALGSNMLGSLLGGIASMLSMQVGFSALLLLTLAIYLAVLLLLFRRNVQAG